MWGISPPPPPILATHLGIWRTNLATPNVGKRRRGGLGGPLPGFPPNTRNIVFCLILLIYLISRLCFWCYILLLTQRFFWYYCSHQVMATFCCVTQQAAPRHTGLSTCANIVKPTQTPINREKYTFCLIKSLEHQKNLKTGHILCLGLELTIHVLLIRLHMKILLFFILIYSCCCF